MIRARVLALVLFTSAPAMAEHVVDGDLVIDIPDEGACVIVPSGRVPTAVCDGIDMTKTPVAPNMTTLYFARVPIGERLIVITLKRLPPMTELNETGLPVFEQGFMQSVLKPTVKARAKPVLSVSRIHDVQVIASSVAVTIEAATGSIDQTIATNQMIGKNAAYILTTITSDADTFAAKTLMNDAMESMKLKRATTPSERAGERARTWAGTTIAAFVIPSILGVWLLVQLVRKRSSQR